MSLPRSKRLLIGPSLTVERDPDHNKRSTLSPVMYSAVFVLMKKHVSFYPKADSNEEFDIMPFTISEKTYIAWKIFSGVRGSYRGGKEKRVGSRNIYYHNFYANPDSSEDLTCISATTRPWTFIQYQYRIIIQ